MRSVPCFIQAQRDAYKAGAKVRYHKGFRFTEKALDAEAEKVFPYPVLTEADIWTTASGNRIVIEEMDDEHLDNCIRFIERRLAQTEGWPEKLVVMKREMKRRQNKPYVPYHCPCGYCEARRRAR